ncbi:hypothetical protein Pcinc_025925 [Petrolisthes cinctipes]|uniref:Scavenger receptor class B member 1 n=1 Tax=Petrolisthes cinctipes TaxID=88211 RepID=A0AAE1KAV1_PETCI|nr:hypothetical protein Pcinc_025925 [Petrolisthes cinctipes]
MLVLKEDSSTLDAFLIPPVPIYMQFYLFNVTNPEEIRFKGAKPIIREVGPYTYDEHREKYDLQWDHTEGTVTYYQNKSFVFNQEMSPGHSEDDPVTTINAVMVSIASKVEPLGPVVEALVEFAFLRFSETIFITKTVKELLWGYDEPLMTELSKYVGDPTNNKGKFGFFYPVNNTNDGNYTVKTGEKGLGDYLHITQWKGLDILDYWSTDYCNMINGSDGSQYPPRISHDSVLEIYTSEMCRSLYLTYEKDVWWDGVHTYRFIPPKAMLEDPMINPDNMCYCYPGPDDCLGAGMLNMAPCAHGAPVIMSTPHFYQGDEVELAKLDGLDPQKSQHETILDVEPKTGVTMHAEKKIQINVPLRPYGNLPSFKNVPEVIFPVLWVNESAAIDSALAKDVNKATFLPFLIVDIVFGALLVLGIVLLVIAGIKFRRIRRNRGQHKL